MTPTLAGRLQTRWVMVWTVGLLWLIVAGPFLPLAGAASAVYMNGLAALVLVSVLGVGWELLYHGLQQFRWDKDWPIILGLVLGISEGALVYWFLSMGFPWVAPGLALGAFAWQFATVWIVIWMVVNGPLRIFFPRWRFAGGRFW